MWSLRVQLSVCLAVLWLPMTNSCFIAAAFPELMTDVCECDGEKEDGAPMPFNPTGPGHCALCSTLSSGVNLSALASLVLPAPVLSETAGITVLIGGLTPSELLRAPSVPPNPESLPAPAWREVLTKALPVRGPSLVA